ncbi:hypothetical protein [Neobacillus sp. PS2-9]|uniref:hypothetical protein n=1 Tax=Neobacillus sp. PS2-9 TaxID=3070676 RepID=UPI0027E0BF8B|nr:hypothetical protein [Neobacillus sp. PS2-9]WML56246.1 hypothetical protein RCG25_15030 [Neobacillus sp. PS2-9]
MKKELEILGYVLFCSGIFLFGLMHLSIAMYIPNLNWSDPPGKLASALNQIIGWVTYTISILLIIIGGFIVVQNLMKTKARGK